MWSHIPQSNRPSGQSSPHSLPYIPNVSPRPDTGLTYIQREPGWDGAMQTTLKPDQLTASGLKELTRTPGFRQTGVSMHCITSWMFTCYFNCTTESRQDLSGVLGLLHKKRVLNVVKPHFCFCVSDGF